MQTSKVLMLMPNSQPRFTSFVLTSFFYRRIYFIIFAKTTLIREKVKVNWQIFVWQALSAHYDLFCFYRVRRRPRTG